MKRLECLDGLRGILAAYVLLGHAAPFAAIPTWLAHALSHGGAAVDVFFTLSGLVIMRSLESFRFQARPFLIARIARIFPLYLLLFALALSVQPLPIDYARLPWIAPTSPAHDIWSSGWPAAWPADIAAHLAMLHGLFPNCVLPAAWVSLFGAAWSLSTEWQFYLLAMLLAARLGPRRLVLLLLCIAMLGLAWQIAAPEPWRFSRAFLPNRAQFFALGIASANLLRGTAGLRGYAAVLAATLALCGAGGRPEKLLPPLIWTICLLAQRHPLHWTTRAINRTLRHPALLRLGLWSYGIYLANEPIQKALGVTLAYLVGGNARLFTALWIPAALGLPVLVAAWLHRTVEAPALRFGRNAALMRASSPA